MDLQPLNTLAVPATAEWFCEVDTRAQLLDALSFARQKHLPVTLLGGGSNVILPPLVKGLVIKNALSGRSLVFDSDEEVVLECAAGENWHDTVMWCVERGYCGIENLALIPGTVGAAPIQNIGAYGVELACRFDYLEAMDIATGEITRLNRVQCQFGYRDSIFKGALQDKVIILAVALRLYKQPRLVLDYPALAQALGGAKQALSAKEVACAVIAIRQSRLPDPGEIPNAGSFFKNPIVSRAVFQSLQSQYADIVAYPLEGGQYKLAAAWLLDKGGWKGKLHNNMGMHQRQALVLTNPGRCSGPDILAFAERVRGAIEQRFGVSLELEPRVYGG